ncbi:MAG: Rne/Rng family ribonuclease [Acidobacteria bacterium]|nr:Rne/Rng family ribonuclease [Acidobacteriota bacterium]
MSKELVISSNRHETKVAILEDDSLVEIYFQRANEYSLAGSIHKGRVTRVLPGMQSAFVDLGLERDTFLYVSDFFDDHHEDVDRVHDDKPQRERGRREHVRAAGASPTEVTLAEAEAGIIAEPPPIVEGTEGEAQEGESSAAAGTEVKPFPERDRRDRKFSRDRRGRRGRRGRDGRDRGGFPESKYASDVNAPASEPEVVEEPDEPAAEAAAAEEEVFVLPGESLAKYRRRPEPRREAGEPVVEETITAPEPEPEPEPEPVAVAASEPAVEAVVEAEVAAPEPPPVVEYVDASFAKLAPEVDAAELEEVDAIEEAREELLTETDDEEDEADAAQRAAEELLASEGGEAVESGEDGPEPARQPQSLTATLRENDRGSRFQRGRRGRRRRGGRDRDDRGPRPAGEDAPAGEAAAPEAPAPAEQAPRAERDRDRDRDRDRGDRRQRDRGDRPPLPLITDLLKAGQEILVQIAKEPIGQKGARITSHIALPGRYCVYMPTVDHNGVSRKIASDEERHRLKRILQKHREGMPGGFIIRTAGEGHTEDDIANDMQFLYNLWLDIRTKAEKRNAPALVHHDLDIVQRTLRDQVSSDFKTIWMDNEELYASTVQFVERFQPALVNRVKLWTRSVPIFDAFNITTELEKALRPKVWLKSGGYIVINQTEALVAIDINTGKFVGKSNRLEDTIVKTNTEAVKEIVRQIRLRDLGGIIVVDFIDMDERKNRQKVMQALEEAMRVDRAPYKILQFNDFGLVAITRKRVKQSLERTLCQPCIYCDGAGYVKSVATVIGEIMLEAQKLSKAIDSKNVVLRVHPEVAKVMKSHRNQHLEELEHVFGRPVLVTGDPTVHIEKFDLA